MPVRCFEEIPAHWPRPPLRPDGSEVRPPEPFPTRPTRSLQDPGGTKTGLGPSSDLEDLEKATPCGPGPGKAALRAVSS